MGGPCVSLDKSWYCLACRIGVIFSRFSGERRPHEAGVKRETRGEGSSSKKEKALVPHCTGRLVFASQLRNPVLQANYQQVCPSTHYLAVFAFLLRSKA